MPIRKQRAPFIKTPGVRRLKNGSHKVTSRTAIVARSIGVKRWQFEKPDAPLPPNTYVIPPDRLDEFLQSGLTAEEFLKSIGAMPESVEPVPIPEPKQTSVPAKVYKPSTEMMARDKTERLACEWMAKHFNGCLEFNTPVGRIDVLSESTVYEVKQARNWKHALGQVLAYSHYFPDRQKTIVLVGKVDQFIDAATYHCGLFGVDVLSFDDI
jgi:hypothetical protein